MKRVREQKRISYLMACLLIVVFCGVNGVCANAKENAGNVTQPEDFGEPISVTTYVNDEGNTVTEKVYAVLDDAATRSKSGSGWYRNEKTETWSSGKSSTYYAQGYFVWGDGEVSVSSPSGDISEVSGITVSNKSTTYGTGRYGYVFNKYAYVTFSCTTTSIIGGSKNLSVTIRVSESGNTL